MVGKPVRHHLDRCTEGVQAIVASEVLHDRSPSTAELDQFLLDQLLNRIAVVHEI